MKEIIAFIKMLKTKYNYSGVLYSRLEYIDFLSTITILDETKHSPVFIESGNYHAQDIVISFLDYETL